MLSSRELSRRAQRVPSREIHQSKAMPVFVPSDYLSMRDALDRVGRKLFQAAWTGEEHKARRGLISEVEWLRIKDLPPARGGGAGIERPPSTKPLTPHSTGDPSDPLYQEEYRARERYIDAQDRLRQMLEAGELEAAILDPWTGNCIKPRLHCGASTMLIG